jgi:hypothetical protein
MAEVKREILKVDNGAEGFKTVKMEFPSNSSSSKKEVKKIIKGNVKQRKKPFMKKLTDTFVGEDVDNVWEYLFYDVLVPATKNTLVDMVQGGVEMLLFGEKRRNNIQRNADKSYISYNGISSNSSLYNRNSPTRDSKRDISYRGRSSHNFDEIILTTRGEAEEVISHLADLVVDYGQASVADLYDLVGITGQFTDNKYGWRDLSSASVSRLREGFVLNLPKTIILD